MAPTVQMISCLETDSGLQMRNVFSDYFGTAIFYRFHKLYSESSYIGSKRKTQLKLIPNLKNVTFSALNLYMNCVSAHKTHWVMQEITEHRTDVV